MNANDMFDQLVPLLAPVLSRYGGTLNKKQAAELALRSAVVGVIAGSQMLNCLIQANLLLAKTKA